MTVFKASPQQLLTIVLCTVCWLSILAPKLHATSEDENRLPPTINIETTNTPLSEVTATISAQTGLNIILDQSLSQLPVSGNYSNINAEQFFSRFLKDKDVVLHFDSNNNSLKIIAFAKGDQGTQNNQIVAASTVPTLQGEDSPLPDSIIDELNLIHGQQLNTVSDDEQNSLIPGSKTTIAELNARQLEQQNLTPKDLPENESPLGINMKTSHLNALHKKRAALHSSLNDDNVQVLIDSTITALNEQHLDHSPQTRISRVKQSTIMGTDSTISNLNAEQTLKAVKH